MSGSCQSIGGLPSCLERRVDRGERAAAEELAGRERRGVRGGQDGVLRGIDQLPLLLGVGPPEDEDDVVGTLGERARGWWRR